MDICRLAICQFFVTDDKKVNLKKAIQMIDRAGAEGADLVLLPESFTCPYELKRFSEYAEETSTGETTQVIGAHAKRHGLWIVAGSLPEKEGELLYNTSLIFNPAGNLAAKYRKVHLFDIDIPGQVTFMESDIFQRGSEPVVIKEGPVPFGVAICYDLRFPEWFRKMALLGAELILLPAVFSPVTGPTHWELLLRTRAVDNQVYVAGCAQAQNPGKNLNAYGHSLVADPWGDIITRTGEGEALLLCSIDRGRIQQIRRQLPLLKNMRQDLYKD